MSALSRLSTLHIPFTYAIPLLHIAYGYFYFHQVQTQPVVAGSWQLLGILMVDIIGLVVAIRWKNTYLGSLYVALLLLVLGSGLLLSIGEGAGQGLTT
jgi:hypothetical protein